MSALSSAGTVTLPLALRRFGLHFLEMCVVMCPGGIVLDIATFGGLGALGFDVLARPELAMMLVAVNFAIVMAVYMKLRGHAPQHNIEMSGSTIVGGLAFVGLYWLGVVPEESLASVPKVFALLCTPLCALMFVVMLVRFDHYGGRIGAPIAVAAAGDYTCPMHPEVAQAGPGRCPTCGMTLVRRS